MGKFEHGFGTQLGAVFAVAKGRFWKPDACSLEPPNKSLQETKKERKEFFFKEFRRGVRQFLWVSLSTVSARN